MPSVLLVLETRARKVTLVCGVTEFNGAPSFKGRPGKWVSFVAHGLYFAFHTEDVTDFVKSGVYSFFLTILCF